MKEEKQSEPKGPEQTPVKIKYAAANSVDHTEKESMIRLFGDLYRDPVDVNAAIKNPIRFRESMSALSRVVSSDYRYSPKDRSAYLAYKRMKNESAGMNSWQARQAYFSWLERNDPDAWLILDPVVTVHPDEIFFEVFSKDEGSYAKLAMSHKAFDFEKPPVFGTTNIDFSESLLAGIKKMRTGKKTSLGVSREEVSLKDESGGSVLEKKINLPDSWLRGFLQVQSAAMLPTDSFKMAPIDFYNLLRNLRFNSDIKGKPRGLRIELVPGDYPKMVVEPRETLIETTQEIYKGKTARVVRIWGRRRLMMLKQFLPFTTEIDVRIIGSGMPSFWILKGEDTTFTLGMTGFTAFDWSRALSFDLLLPRKASDTSDLEKILTHLSDRWLDSHKGIAKAVDIKGAELLKALQSGCQQGKLMYDISKDVYRLRPLTSEPLDMARLEFRNQRERFAHDLLNRKDAVKIESENRIFGTGVELVGKADVKEDRREYRPTMLINEEGQVVKAECTCTLFRKQKLKQGPCPHLLALRIAHVQQTEKQMKNTARRKRIMLETRTYTKRAETGEDVCQLTLDRQILKMRWGRKGQDLRVQNLRFNSVDEARQAYFTRADHLGTRGYLDATTG